MEVTEILCAFKKLSIEKQQNILNAAASIFAQEGYHYASISNICQKAGISNGALYKYFKNKEALFLSVLDYGVNLVEEKLYRKYTANAKSVYQAIKNLLNEMIEFTKENGDHISIYSDLGSGSMNRFALGASDKYKNATSLYTIRLVEMGKAIGEIDINIRNDIAACLIDNYITLFSYTLVSEYHTNRFDSFFWINEKSLSKEERVDIIINSLKMVFN